MDLSICCSPTEKEHAAGFEIASGGMEIASRGREDWEIQRVRVEMHVVSQPLCYEKRILTPS